MIFFTINEIRAIMGIKYLNHNRHNRNIGFHIEIQMKAALVYRSCNLCVYFYVPMFLLWFKNDY